VLGFDALLGFDGNARVPAQQLAETAGATFDFLGGSVSRGGTTVLFGLAIGYDGATALISTPHLERVRGRRVFSTRTIRSSPAASTAGATETKPTRFGTRLQWNWSDATALPVRSSALVMKRRHSR
jgi:hypothetical protein